MKLINRTILFLSGILLVTITLWAILIYLQLLKQVKTTVDEGLASYKIVIIDRFKDENSFVQHEPFHENNYVIRRIDEEYALQVRDSYKDTLIYSQLKDKYLHTRMLTTAFVASDGRYFEMKLISPELEEGKFLKKIATSLFWLFLFMFVCTIVINHFVLKKTWKPFYQLLNLMNNFRLDREMVWKMTEPKIQEFALLNDSIRNLLKTNVDIYISQKQFIENAAHELQTPLAIGINKLELLAGENDLSQEQMQKIGSIIEVFQRLSNLNKVLLLISKIENKQFDLEDNVVFDEIISKTIDDFADFAEYQKISISFLKEDDWEHKMNKNLAEILVLNIIKNALIYNQPHGKIIIRLSEAFFSVENTSSEPSQDSDKLFRRFNKNLKNSNSTGLGLAIVKSVADVSGLSVTYSYNGRHVFKVSKKNL